jgi:hypothetical protein
VELLIIHARISGLIDTGPAQGTRFYGQDQHKQSRMNAVADLRSMIASEWPGLRAGRLGDFCSPEQKVGDRDRPAGRTS